MLNVANIPLPLAAWLAHDSYDYVNRENYISVTSIIQPVSISVMEYRARSQGLIPEPDVADFVATRSGTAVHDQIETFWRSPDIWKKALKKLDIPDSFISSLTIDPDVAPPKGTPTMYMERRAMKEFHGAVIGGKYDVVYNGQVMDYKQTSTYSYTSGARDKVYQMQGSIYRWLSPQIITEDTMKILFLFKDWKKSMCKEGYPIAPAGYKEYSLLPFEEVEEFIRQRLDAIYKLRDVPTFDLPPPESDSLLKSEVTYKYFSDPAKVGGRATRVFDTAAEANMFAAGKSGIIVPVRSSNYELERYNNLKELLCSTSHLG